MKGKRKSKKRTYKPNGIHEQTKLARERVLKVAKKRGSITTRQAGIIGQWPQAGYHLNAMVKARQLKKDRYSVWVPR